MGLYYLIHHSESGDTMLVSNNRKKLKKYAKKNGLNFHSRINKVNGDVLAGEIEGNDIVPFEDHLPERVRNELSDEGDQVVEREDSSEPAEMEEDEGGSLMDRLRS